MKIVSKIINSSMGKSILSSKYSQLSCQQMDLYLDLIENNRKNAEIAEKKEKYQDAINYCINIIKVKKKLYGIDNKSQIAENIKMADLYAKLGDNEKALSILDDALAISNQNDDNLREIFSKKAKILKLMNGFEESVKNIRK